MSDSDRSGLHKTLADNWRPLFVVAVGLILTVYLAWRLQPEKSYLPGYQPTYSKSDDYQAGGRGCSPKALAAIGDIGKRAAKSDDCAEKAEDYRLKADDLIQQSRAADAAQSQARSAYEQGWLVLWATIGGLWTLIAAGLAAAYARDAAREGKRSADLANSSLEYTKLMTQRQSEAIVYFAGAEYRDKPQEDILTLGNFGVVTFTLQNFGKLIAYDVEATINILAPDFEQENVKLILADEKFGKEFYPAGRSRKYTMEFRWPSGLKKRIIYSHQNIEIEFSISYNLDSEHTELFAHHEGSMLAFLTQDSSRADFIPPYAGWHANEQKPSQ